MPKSPSKPTVEFQTEGNKVKIRHSETGEVLAWCYIGDDDNVEAIADILSAKGLPNAAMKLRQMAMDARKAPGPEGMLGKLKRLTGL